MINLVEFTDKYKDRLNIKYDTVYKIVKEHIDYLEQNNIIERAKFNSKSKRHMLLIKDENRLLDFILKIPRKPNRKRESEL